jgi:hypothetical protein
MVRKRGVARKSFARRRVRRVKKYDSHVTPLRYKKYLPDMAELLKPPLDIHVECEVPCMELLASLGVPLSEYPYYLGFMKRMIVLYRNFTSETLASEKESLIEEYVLRGKDRDVLEAVQEVAAECAGVEVEMDLWTKDFYVFIMFHSLDPYTWSWGGTGYYLLNPAGNENHLVLGTGATAASLVELQYFWDIPDPSVVTFLTWDKERRMRTAVRFEANTNQEAYILTGDTSNGFGFKIVDNQIFGVVFNGAVETLTAALATFAAFDEMILEARFKPNQECRFYINGVEVGVLTAGLPTGTNDADSPMWLRIENTADEDKVMDFSWYEFYQKR